jgi:hypothetical protein
LEHLLVFSVDLESYQKKGEYTVGGAAAHRTDHQGHIIDPFRGAWQATYAANQSSYMADFI